MVKLMILLKQEFAGADQAFNNFQLVIFFTLQAN